MADGRGTLSSLVRHPVAVSAVHLVGATALASVAGFLFWILATRAYPPAAIGAAGTMVATTGFLALVADVGLNQAAPLAHARGEIRPFTIGALAVSALLSIALGTALVVIAPHLDPALRFPPLEALGIVFVLVSTTALYVLNAAIIAAGQPRLLTVAALVSNAGKLAVLSGAVLLALPIGLLFSWAVAGLTAAVIATAALLKRLPPSDVGAADVVGRWAGFGGLSSVAALAQQGGLLLLPLVLLPVLAAEEVGMIFVALQVATIPLLLPDIVIRAVYGTGSPRAASRLSRLGPFAVATSFVAALGIAAFAPWVLSLYGNMYGSGALILILFLAAAPAYSILGVWAAAERLREKPMRVAVLYGVQAVAALSMSLALAARWGPVGGAAGFLIAQWAAAVVALSTYPRQ